MIGTVTGSLRAELLLDGKEFPYESAEEFIALSVMARRRGIMYVQPLFAAADPKKVDQLLKQYRALVYPEERLNDLLYIQKARKFMEKMRGISFTITGVGA